MSCPQKIPRRKRCSRGKWTLRVRGRSKWAGVYGCFTRHPAANRALDRLYGCHLDEGLSPDQVWGYELTKD